MFNLDNQFLIFYTGEATKSFSLHSYEQMLTFKRTDYPSKIKKKSKNMNNPKLQKSKKIKKNPQKKSL